MQLNNLEERIKVLSEYQEEVVAQVHTILTDIAKEMQTNDILFNLRLIWPTLIGNTEDETVTLTLMHIRERVAPNDMSDIQFTTSDGNELIIDDFLSSPRQLLMLIEAVKKTGRAAIDVENISVDELKKLSRNFLANIPDTFVKFIDRFAENDMFEYADAWSQLFKIIKQINSLDVDQDNKLK